MRYLTYDEMAQRINDYELPLELLDYCWYATSKIGSIIAFFLSVKYNKPYYIDQITLVNSVPFGEPVLLIDDVFTPHRRDLKCIEDLEIKMRNINYLVFWLILRRLSLIIIS
jgi:hypothetical protein